MVIFEIVLKLLETFIDVMKQTRIIPKGLGL